MGEKWWQDPRIYSHHSVFKTMSGMYPLSLSVKPKKFYETFESSSKKSVICTDLFAIGILNRKAVTEAPDKNKSPFFALPIHANKSCNSTQKTKQTKKPHVHNVLICRSCLSMEINVFSVSLQRNRTVLFTYFPLSNTNWCNLSPKRPPSKTTPLPKPHCLLGECSQSLQIHPIDEIIGLIGVKWPAFS